MFQQITQDVKIGNWVDSSYCPELDKLSRHS